MKNDFISQRIFGSGYDVFVYPSVKQRLASENPTQKIYFTSSKFYVANRKNCEKSHCNFTVHSNIWVLSETVI